MRLVTEIIMALALGFLLYVAAWQRCELGERKQAVVQEWHKVELHTEVYVRPSLMEIQPMEPRPVE